MRRVRPVSISIKGQKWRGSIYQWVNMQKSKDCLTRKIKERFHEIKEGGGMTATTNDCMKG